MYPLHATRFRLVTESYKKFLRALSARLGSLGAREITATRNGHKSSVKLEFIPVKQQIALQATVTFRVGEIIYSAFVETRIRRKQEWMLAPNMNALADSLASAIVRQYR